MQEWNGKWGKGWRLKRGARGAVKNSVERTGGTNAEHADGGAGDDMIRF